MLEARNAGKPIGDARGEMGMVVATFRYYAGAPERLLGDTIPVAGGQAFTVREPLGVVGLIVPWNFPLAIASWKLGPALAAGNTVVLKPAELTPLTALRFAEIARRGRDPGGRRQRRRRARAHLRPAARRAPGRRQDRVHRLDRGRPLDRRRRGRDDQARHARARRQVAERRVRRRRPRGRRGGGADGRVRQRRPGLLRALADPRRGLGARSSSWGARARGQGDPRRRPARRGDPDGAADLRRPARDGRVVRRRRRARWRSAAARPTAPATGSRRRCCARSTRTRARPARRSSGRWRP